MRPILLILAALLLSSATFADEYREIRNYLDYGPLLSSAGQPSEAELASLSKAGFERVINLAFNSKDEDAMAEDAVAKRLGLDYIQIPVIWAQPTVKDFQVFAAVMQSSPDARTLVHCQANYRATAFSFLYRVAVLDEDAAEARRAMESIWSPNEAWTDFINATLDAYGVDYDY